MKKPKLQFTPKQYSEVIDLLKTLKDPNLRRKLQVLQLRMEGFTAAEVMKITGYSRSGYTSLWRAFVRDGISYFKQENRKRKVCD